MTRTFDLVLFGATGFTGRLVAERFARRAPASFRLAFAGRDRVGLEALIGGLGFAGNVAALEVDANDVAGVRGLAESGKVVASTVGPYRTYGANLVRACAEAGTDYVDLAGEADWIGDMIDANESTALTSGARIVPCCGFDSVPSELGVSCLQALCRERWGVPATYVGARVLEFEAAYSGGTLATAAQMAQDAADNAQVVRRLADPFVMTPGFQGPAQPPLDEARWDALTMGWVAPFPMSRINTRIVHRANLLSGHAWGRGLQYDEMTVVPGSAKEAESCAKAMASADTFAGQDIEPGKGPSAEALASGGFDIRYVGQHPAHGHLTVAVKGDREPAYTTSACILAEAALCLACDGVRAKGGFWTPITLMGDALIDRLRLHAGVTAEALDDG